MSVEALVTEVEALVAEGRPRAALERAEEAVRASAGLSAPLRAAALHARARARDALGDVEAAWTDLQAARDIEPRSPQRWLFLAQLAVSREEWETAQDLFAATITVAEEVDEPSLVARGRWELGMLARITGDPDAARREFAAAVAISEAVGDEETLVYAEFALAELDQQAGDVEQASARYARVRALAEALPGAERRVTAEPGEAAGGHAGDHARLPAPVDREPVLQVVLAPGLGEQAELAFWPGEGAAPLRCLVPFRVAVHPRTEERLRWYTEEYAARPIDPAPAIAADVETELEHLGGALFDALFDHVDAAEIAAAVRDQLARVRIEIVADTLRSDALPWELLRDVTTGADIALAARSIGRTTTAATSGFGAMRDDDEVRILVVIARPEGRLDVGFRSIAGPLLRELTASGAAVSVDVLRPPTFEQLQIVLRAAREDGHPYDLVHFDGHGEVDPGDGRGALVFEADDERGTLVGGDTVGELLRACDVPLLVLNACRSAAGGDERTYGSVAREALEQGLAAVVAMRFNVYVPSAALFVGGLYRALGEGRELPDAVTEARRRMAEGTDRDGLPVVRDWCVPALYQAASVRLATAAAHGHRPTGRESALPLAPTHGFVGRDEVFVELEGALARGPHVMMRSFSGAGKTTAACEFGRWYVNTGGCGVAGPLVNLADAPSAAELRRRIGVIEDRSLVIWDDVRELDREHELLLDELAARGGRVLATTDRLPGTERLPLVSMPNLPGEEGLALAMAVAAEAGSSVSAEDAVELWRGTRGHALAIESAVRELARRDVPLATLMQELENPTNGDPAAWARPVGADLDIDHAPPEVTLVARFRGMGTVIGLAQLRDGGEDLDAAEEVLEDLRGRGLVVRISDAAFVIHPGLPVALAANGAYEAPDLGFARAFAEAVNTWVGVAELHGMEVPWRVEAPNILAARRIASRERDWPLVIKLLDAVAAYGRDAGGPGLWHDEIMAAAPDFIDPETGVARPGMEPFHAAILGHLATAADLVADYATAVRLRREDVQARRAAASAALTIAPERRDGAQQDLVRRLAVGLTNLGPSESLLGDAGALATMDEALALARELDDWGLEARNHLNRGAHYMTVSRPIDFDRADAEFVAGYNITIPNDDPFAGMFMTERGTVHYERALVSQDPEEREAQLLQAATLLEFATGLRAPDAVLFHQLGQVHRQLGNLTDARAWFEQAIELREQERVPGAGADARLHLAGALEEAGLIDEAISFARSAEQLLTEAPEPALELELEQTLARLALLARS